ncbi:hypothetical protein [Pedobacter jeongneungensis]|uniref:hypothetical protein n=1 Tax=Pedobacter jeongneungensis TaxID=947309 RepID=UPI000469DAE5|nr:hypothetical protein [Pedobacter jeongneungensis]
METILTDADYKLVINRIALLSSKHSLSAIENEELNQLSAMAIAYECRRYDFTISQSYQNRQICHPER